MPQAILNQILDQLQTLEPSELEQLSQAIQRYLKDIEASAKRVAFHQAFVCPTPFLSTNVGAIRDRGILPKGAIGDRC